MQTGTKAVSAAVSPMSGGLGPRSKKVIKIRPQTPCERIDLKAEKVLADACGTLLVNNVSDILVTEEFQR